MSDVEVNKWRSVVPRKYMAEIRETTFRRDILKLEESGLIYFENNYWYVILYALVRVK